jgi:DNA mismatch repair protein MutS2
LEEVRGRRALVISKGKRLWVELDELEVQDDGGTAPRRPTVLVEAGEEPDRELMLLGMDGERAREEVERFLDRALTAGTATVRIVHGHGTGVLRRVVADVCRSHPAVRSYQHAPRARGGTGATEVVLHES